VTSPISDSKCQLLVIGYGNELRCDDGVGPKVAEAVDQKTLPGVRVIACHQLMPELAEVVSQARCVVFVDAALDEPKEVRFRSLDPAESSQLMTHAADPRTLLAMARDVYGRCPMAWWLTIPIEKLEFGEDLSPRALRGFRIALDKIQELALSRGNTKGFIAEMRKDRSSARRSRNQT
jgi:hydrogenase maturation protease